MQRFLWGTKEDAQGAAALTPVAEEARVVGIERVERRDRFGSFKGLPLCRGAVRREVRPVWAEPVRPLKDLIIQADVGRAPWWQGRGRQLDLLLCILLPTVLRHNERQVRPDHADTEEEGPLRLDGHIQRGDDLRRCVVVDEFVARMLGRHHRGANVEVPAAFCLPRVAMICRIASD